MHFTLIFNRRPEGAALTYDLVFHPCPVWRKGETEVAAPDRSSPHYAIGHLGVLLEKENFKAENMHSPSVMVICHATGQGTAQDLNLLRADLKSESFTPEIQVSGPGVWDEILGT
jgi:hypothetical protein